MYQIAILLVFIVPAILFLVSQQRILQVISPGNREMSPGLVWLQLIPFFGMVWQFFVVTRISRSVSKELASKIGESILEDAQVQIKGTDESSTYTIGITYCILSTLGFIINYSMMHSASSLKLFGSLFFLTGMICWIIYWVSLVKTKNKLVASSVGMAR